MYHRKCYVSYRALPACVLGSRELCPALLSTVPPPEHRLPHSRTFPSLPSSLLLYCHCEWLQQIYVSLPSLPQLFLVTPGYLPLLPSTLCASLGFTPVGLGSKVVQRMRMTKWQPFSVTSECVLTSTTTMAKTLRAHSHQKVCIYCAVLHAQ